MTVNADRPYEARLVSLREGDGWCYAVFDCTPPNVLRNDPVLERVWNNPEDEVFNDQR